MRYIHTARTSLSSTPNTQTIFYQVPPDVRSSLVFLMHNIMFKHERLDEQEARQVASLNAGKPAPRAVGGGPVAWVAIGDSSATAPGFFFAFLACTQPRVLCTQASLHSVDTTTTHMKRDSAIRDTSTLHVPPSARPQTHRPLLTIAWRVPRPMVAHCVSQRWCRPRGAVAGRARPRDG